MIIREGENIFPVFGKTRESARPSVNTRDENSSIFLAYPKVYTFYLDIKIDARVYSDGIFLKQGRDEEEENKGTLWENVHTTKNITMKFFWF